MQHRQWAGMFSGKGWIVFGFDNELKMYVRTVPESSLNRAKPNRVEPNSHLIGLIWNADEQIPAANSLRPIPSRCNSVRTDDSSIQLGGTWSQCSTSLIFEMANVIQPRRMSFFINEIEIWDIF